MSNADNLQSAGDKLLRLCWVYNRAVVGFWHHFITLSVLLGRMCCWEAWLHHSFNVSLLKPSLEGQQGGLHRLGQIGSLASACWYFHVMAFYWLQINQLILLVCHKVAFEIEYLSVSIVFMKLCGVVSVFLIELSSEWRKWHCVRLHYKETCAIQA